MCKDGIGGVSGATTMIIHLFSGRKAESLGLDVAQARGGDRRCNEIRWLENGTVDYPKKLEIGDIDGRFRRSRQKALGLQRCTNL